MDPWILVGVWGLLRAFFLVFGVIGLRIGLSFMKFRVFLDSSFMVW